MNDISYFEWLCELVNAVSPDEIAIAKRLNDIYYKYHFVLDKNRAIAGETLRVEYCDIFGVARDDVQDGPCTVFECLVALSMRMSENADISVEDAYTIITSNLKLNRGGNIESKVNDWLNGLGNTPFPLKYYSGDERNLDLWSAMNIYISENFPLRNDWLD